MYNNSKEKGFSGNIHYCESRGQDKNPPFPPSSPTFKRGALWYVNHLACCGLKNGDSAEDSKQAAQDLIVLRFTDAIICRHIKVPIYCQ